MGLLKNLAGAVVMAAGDAANREIAVEMKDKAREREIILASEVEARRVSMLEGLRAQRQEREAQQRQASIGAKMSQNAELELDGRYAEPVAGDTPLTPEQQAVQAEGIKRQRIEREREKLMLMRQPEAMLQASMELGYGGEKELLAHRDKQELATARREADGAKQEAKLMELSLRYGPNGVNQAKPPAGYRNTADGNLEAIPGGPADIKLQGAFNADTAALSGGMDGFNRLGVAANQLLSHPGLNGILGMQGKLPNFPGGDAADAAALLENLKSQVGFSVLQDMRNNSKTGGALGSVSDAEGKRLEANLAALDTKQSPEQFRRNLQQILSYVEGAKSRLQGAFNLKHGPKDGDRQGAGSPPRINSPAELDALPSGALFTAPDGSIRRKP